MGKSIDATKALLKEIAFNNYHWSSARTTLKTSSGIYEVEVVTFLASRVDALARRLDRVGTPTSVGV